VRCYIELEGPHGGSFPANLLSLAEAIQTPIHQHVYGLPALQIASIASRICNMRDA
jgi:hypothetical protein